MSNELDELDMAAAHVRAGDALKAAACIVRHLRSTPHPAPKSSPSEENAGACPTCKGRGGFMSTARGKGGQMSTECLDCKGTGKVGNAGEGASDEELEELFLREMGKAKVDAGQRVDLGTHARIARRALYDLGKQHQASADAATIAGLRRVVAYFDKYGETIVESCDPADDSSMAEDTEALIASLRPEPGGGK